MTYALFGRLADRFDWHTSPHHYQHDHAFVLERLGESRRVLDVGCGTGVFLERAVMAGFDAIGIDAAPEMVAIAAGRVGAERVHVERMQDIDETSAYDGVVSLSWSFNYVQSLAEAHDVLERLFRALRPKGHLILQIAHAPNAVGALGEDRESGPDGSRKAMYFFCIVLVRCPTSRACCRLNTSMAARVGKISFSRSIGFVRRTSTRLPP